MKKSTFKPFLLAFLLLLSFGLHAQNALWTKASPSETQNRQKAYRNSVPQEFNLFKLNTPALKTILANAPERFSGTSNVIIDLPTNNGEMQRFRVYEASVMEPALQAQHPNIRSYAAQGIDDGSAVARFSVSDVGVHVMISSPNYPTVYIDPYTSEKGYYINYSRKDLPAPLETFVCHVEDAIGPRPAMDENTDVRRGADDGMLRTYRLALAANGEYSLWHLNNQGIDPGASDEVKKAAVLAAQNVAMTRVNGIYERDVSLTMVIIANNVDIIFLNPATDGLDNTSNVINQIQAKIDGIIGAANYDIGHVFTTGGGGIAQLQSPCGPNKARGVTGLPQPIGDPFYVDYVSHEMGHQYGGNHTQNNSCQRSSASYEPGSASTIMGYAGICPPNVQNASDDYFHGFSINEMWNFVKFGGGQCSVNTPTNNLPPVANAGPDYTLPISTPFILRGSAVDPNSGDVLSYCWEQQNNNPAPMPPLNTSTIGPAFRSIDPMLSPDRYMPDISWVLLDDLGGPPNLPNDNDWEVVPSVSRTMNFRLTVRDNVAGGGSSDSDNVVLTFNAAAGPFVVTSQSAATTWTTQTTETITWDVAGTDVAPIDSPNVDILFSTDGGQTYPITIALNIPNNGSAVVNVPNLNTTTGRFMVISSNNIFYDLNNGVITVTGTVDVEEFSFENFAVYPNPSNGSFNLSFKPASNDNVAVTLYDLRGRAISQSTFDDVNASGIFSKQLDYNYVESGMYFLVVQNGNKVSTKKVIIN